MSVQHTWATIGDETKTGNLTARKAIREHCYHCMQSKVHPKDCTSPLCALFPYRPGQKPGARELTEEQRKALKERMEGIRRRGGAKT